MRPCLNQCGKEHDNNNSFCSAECCREYKARNKGGRCDRERAVETASVADASEALSSGINKTQTSPVAIAGNSTGDPRAVSPASAQG